MQLKKIFSKQSLNTRNVIIGIAIIVVAIAATHRTLSTSYSTKKSEKESEIVITIKPKKAQAKLSVTPKVTITTQITQTPSAAPTAKVTSAPQATATQAPVATATSAPTAAPTQVPTDTEAPHTNIMYPGNGGEITYKTDGKVCAIQSAPTDNQSPHNDISLSYKFDNEGWSDFISNLSYVCKDSLPNGAHTLSVKSKDKAGNIENENVISFTVNIENN